MRGVVQDVGYCQVRLLLPSAEILTTSDLSSASFLHASPLTSRLRGSPSSLALRYLQISLQRHDSAKTNFKYRQVVADTLFEINDDKSTGWEMPGWLVHMEMERDAEAWIGRAIRWGWVGEAIGWTRQLLRDVSTLYQRVEQGKGGTRLMDSRHRQNYYPLNDLEWLISHIHLLIGS